MRKQNELSPESAKIRECILQWIDRFSTHFNSPQDEEQIEIFLNALSKYSVYQIETACDRVMKECEFMPRIATISMRIPQERFPAHALPYKLNNRPILDEIRDVAVNISEMVVGRKYASLDSIDDCLLIAKVMSTATRLRYEQMGVDWSGWYDPKQADEWIEKQIKKSKHLTT